MLQFKKNLKTRLSQRLTTNKSKMTFSLIYCIWNYAIEPHEILVQKLICDIGNLEKPKFQDSARKLFAVAVDCMSEKRITRSKSCGAKAFKGIKKFEKCAMEVQGEVSHLH